MVAVEADVPHARRGDELGDPLHHAEPGAQDRHEGELLPGYLSPRHRLERRLDLDRLGGEVLGDLVRHQHGDLAHELLEVPGAGAPVAEDRELVLDERVIEDGEIGKGGGGHGSNIREACGLRAIGRQPVADSQTDTPADLLVHPADARPKRALRLPVGPGSKAVGGSAK